MATKMTSGESANDSWAVTLTRIEDRDLVSRLATRWNDPTSEGVKAQGVTYLFGKYSSVVSCLEKKSCSIYSDLEKARKMFPFCCGVSYEYSNSISCRSLLAFVFDAVSDTGKRDMAPAIAAIDERLLRFYPHLNRQKLPAKWWEEELPNVVVP